MPEHLRALVVILFLGASVFFLLHAPAVGIIGARPFKLRRNLWFGVTLIAFLSNNYWLYVFLTWLLLFFSLPHEKNKVSMFLFLLFAVPGGGYEVPGFGLINYFFNLNHQRLLVFCILLPVFLTQLNSNNKSEFKKNFMDILVISYVVLCILLQFRGTSFTDALRSSFYILIDIYLPYFVISRSLTSLEDFKDTLFSLVAVIAVMSALGIFEIFKYWHLYSGVEDALDLQRSTYYLERDGHLRARTALETIPMGFVIAIGLGFQLFFRDMYSSQMKYYLVTGLIIAGLVSPLSRGPWLGAALLLAVYFLLSPNKLGRIPVLAALVSVVVAVASVTPLGQTLIGLIPFVGDIEAGNITYRQQVITNSWIVIQRNPILGSVDYLSAPEMEALRTGQGIIDIVNTYVSRALKYGLLGLALFAGVFFVACLKVFRSFSGSRHIEPQEKNLGRILLAVLLCIIVTIGTTSPVSAVPIMYWTVLALSSAYCRMIERKRLIIVQEGSVAT